MTNSKSGGAVLVAELLAHLRPVHTTSSCRASEETSAPTRGTAP